ncbi:carboxy terminal-processing peptidase [Panacibacter sp. DH6]|uniref:Carboxy terminal-processing peptidase n=1 Tax=Panacibacter microcysteis TaxID=2793269 RepID=A0A931E410_9BACT|nr:carboxy terminal-processing peptidase [Panacibacter microcysteis]MBG9374885.1 carboxy terminal-processing peptidase [Panacibacter microcysteis]
MMNRKVWPLLLLVLLVSGVLWAFTGRDNVEGEKSNEDKYAKQQKLLTAIGSILEQRHYSPKAIDDNFSRSVFKKYLENLDPEKNLFLQSDIKALSKYQAAIDEEILGKTTMEFYPAAGQIYEKRIGEVMTIYKDLLSKPFDFSANENVQLDGEKIDYAANEEARKEAWRKRLKFMTLERFVDLQQQREKADKKDSMASKTDAQLEKEARTRVLGALDRNYNRLKLVFNADQQFSSFVNTITDLMDPHTEYFAPVDKRGFDEEMSGRFYGIGAQLTEENGSIKIASLVTGSPAWKSGQVQVNDEILKVAQGAEPPVDVAGYAVTDVVKLIRGTKGTEVRITFKKNDGTLQIVSLVRDEIVQDETFARSSVITDDGKKIGYIYLPEFYADFDRPEGNRCSQDVANEVKKLKAENVEGIILDLRNNGGGSLYEVVQMVGLFIKSGPVVQVKDRDGKPITLSDTDPGVLYEGPLAVMVNELSASASEIFAAAIQDYKRGIVVGSTSTYGKGTVQKNLPLGRQDMTTGQTEYGALKLTFEKFYRVNGGSTQLKGVTPDVVLPDVYEYIKFREKDNPSALAWDQIPQADYKQSMDINWAEIQKKADERVSANTAFAGIKKNTDWLSKNTERAYELNLEAYKKQQATLRNTVKQDDTLSKLQAPMDMKPVEVDKDKFFNNADKAKGERYQQWLKSVQRDLYIDETVNIVRDVIAAKSQVTVKQ